MGSRRLLPVDSAHPLRLSPPTWRPSRWRRITPVIGWTNVRKRARLPGSAPLKVRMKEKELAATELEMNALNRRVSGLEEDLEKTEEKMVAAVSKLDKAASASDDSERAKKVFQSKADEEE